MQKGNIGVTTENIFPIIKKFLYSDHEIFLRELVSNAVDATQKLNTLASIGEFKGELGDLTIHVELGKDTITISDRGIGPVSYTHLVLCYLCQKSICFGQILLCQHRIRS